MIGKNNKNKNKQEMKIVEVNKYQKKVVEN